MRITIINEDNMYYFYDLVINEWIKKGKNDVFVGLINDDNKAVAALCAEIEDQYATIKYIASSADELRKGYGKCLLTMFKELLKDTPVYYMRTYLYAADAEVKDELPEHLQEVDNAEIADSFFTACGFEREALDVVRCKYLLEDFAGSGIDKEQMRQVEVKAIAELDAREKAVLIGNPEFSDLYKSVIENAANQEDMYSCVAYKEDELLAYVRVSICADGFLIYSVSAPNGNLSLLSDIYSYLYQLVRKKYKDSTNIYIDVFGEKLMTYMRKMIGKAPGQQMRAIAYEWRVNQ